MACAVACIFNHAKLLREVIEHGRKPLWNRKMHHWFRSNQWQTMWHRRQWRMNVYLSCYLAQSIMEVANIIISSKSMISAWVRRSLYMLLTLTLSILNYYIIIVIMEYNFVIVLRVTFTSKMENTCWPMKATVKLWSWIPEILSTLLTEPWLYSNWKSKH